MGSEVGANANAKVGAAKVGGGTIGARVGEFFSLVTSTARLMVGVPDYKNYVAHAQAKHPDRPVMTYEEFFRNRQEARYKSGVRGCC